MTKREQLDLLMLLSALESFALSTDRTIPDYLHDALQCSLAVLEREILE